MFTYNDNGNWITGSKQHSDEWLPIVKDENGVITEPQGLVDFLTQQEADALVQATNNEARQYLADTDWYILRQLDDGTPMPDDVKALRAEARLKIV